jgi:hypothetical protein
MNSYKLRYYNSGGYKSSLTIETPHTINRNAENNLQLLDESGTVLGDVEAIEQLLNDAQGWVEDNCVYEVEAVDR